MNCLAMRHFAGGSVKTTTGRMRKRASTPSKNRREIVERAGAARSSISPLPPDAAAGRWLRPMQRAKPPSSISRGPWRWPSPGMASPSTRSVPELQPRPCGRSWTKKSRGCCTSRKEKLFGRLLPESQCAARPGRTKSPTSCSSFARPKQITSLVRRSTCAADWSATEHRMESMDLLLAREGWPRRRRFR